MMVDASIRTDSVTVWRTVHEAKTNRTVVSVRGPFFSATNHLLISIVFSYCSTTKLGIVECDESREFLCQADNTCIQKEAFCDGNRDCSDGEDEKCEGRR